MKKAIIFYTVALIATSGVCIYAAFHLASADDSKGFSWTVRSAEIIDDKEAQNEVLRKNIEELNKVRYENRKAIDAERCKLLKLDKNATCEGLAK